jgi:hypothetical protein
MLYNLLGKDTNVFTAGKITIATAFIGILIFAFVFLFNAGKTELMRVEAQSATTTLTVLNTPPQWVQFAVEQTESSVSSPTNSGVAVTWSAIGNDPNGANYYLLICSTNATPTANNSAAPSCVGGTQWGVSAPTASNAAASVSTTTTEVSPFVASNNWYGWICDADAVSARCNDTFSQGLNATNSSPFIVNFRPTFTGFYDNSPADPGATVTFFSTSTDPDGNNIRLIVCNAASYSTSTDTCGANEIASTSGSVTSNATALYTLSNPLRDNNYDAFGYMIDQFGHEAIGATQGSNAILTVNNVAPTVSNASIIINGGANITLTQAASQTTGYTLAFTTTDSNSCRTSADALEVVNYSLSLYRSAVGTSSCSGAIPGEYNPNNCYPSSIATTTWNLACTASTTSCALGGGDATMDWSCTYPLWFVSDPTDGVSPFTAQNWLSAVAGIDNNGATGTLSVAVAGVELLSFSSLSLISPSIPYGQLEPGQNSPTLNASTTIRSVGNTGLDQSLEGESMCGTFAVGNECPNSASSTIPENTQQFGTSSVAYGSGTALSSSTVTQLELNVAKSTSTTTPTSGVTYWGIGVPGTITLAGSYTGLNTFYAVTAEPGDW